MLTKVEKLVSSFALKCSVNLLKVVTNNIYIEENKKVLLMKPKKQR